MTRNSIISEFLSRIKAQDSRLLSKDERETLIDYFIGSLVQCDSRKGIEKLCNDEKKLLEKGYAKNTMNSYLLPFYTRAVKNAVESGRLNLTPHNSYQAINKKTGQAYQRHMALDYLRYDLATIKALRAVSVAKNNERRDDPTRFDPTLYIDTVKRLLSTDDLDTLAIALLSATGRRHSEMIKGKFSQVKRHRYLLKFEGQLKREGKADAFEIVSLLPAKDLLPHIKRLQHDPNIQALRDAKSQDPKLKAMNSRVNQRVRKIFMDTGILPPTKGFKGTTIHRLRSAYAAIAILYFCPPTGDEPRFIGQMLGHIIGEEVRCQADSQATAHYTGYQPMMHDGRDWSAKGIKIPSEGLVLESMTYRTPTPDTYRPANPTSDQGEVARLKQELSDTRRELKELKGAITTLLKLSQP